MTAELRLHAPSYLQQISYSLFILTLVFAPLAFGTTETWSMATLELLTCLAGLLYFLPVLFRKTVLYSVPGLVPLLLLLCWMYLQCIPLPSHYIQHIAPHIFTAYQPILAVKQTSAWIPMTVNLKASLLESMRISTYVLFYILTVQFLSHSSKLRNIVRILTILAIMIAFIALLQKFTSPQKIYWFRTIPASAWQGAMGPWVYPNQYAGFMVMVCPLVAALFFYYQPDIQEQPSVRQRFVDFFSQADSSRYILLGSGVLLILTSVFFSHSRGGMLSISCGLFLFFIIADRKKNGHCNRTALLLFCCFISIAIWFNRNAVWNRLLSTFADSAGGIQDGRFKIWQDAFNIIADFPLTGSGFGTFSDIFPSYKSFSDIYSYAHAHNDYIELLTDGGLIAFIPGAWFVVTILKTGLRQIRIRHDNYAFLVAIGAFCGISGILVYSITDFNLHNGANGLYFFFLCGLLISAGHTRRHFQTRPTLLPRVTSVGMPAAAAVLSITLFTTAIFFVQRGTLYAERLYSRVTYISSAMLRPEKKIRQIRVLLQQAIQYDPLSGRYPHALANIEQYDRHHKKALAYALDAAMKQPMSGEFLQTAAQLLAGSSPKQAGILFDIGSQRGGQTKNHP